MSHEQQRAQMNFSVQLKSTPTQQSRLHGVPSLIGISVLDFCVFIEVPVVSKFASYTRRCFLKARACHAAEFPRR